MTRNTQSNPLFLDQSVALEPCCGGFKGGPPRSVQSNRCEIAGQPLHSDTMRIPSCWHRQTGQILNWTTPIAFNFRAQFTSQARVSRRARHEPPSFVALSFRGRLSLAMVALEEVDFAQIWRGDWSSVSKIMVIPSRRGVRDREVQTWTRLIGYRTDQSGDTDARPSKESTTDLGTWLGAIRGR